MESQDLEDVAGEIEVETPCIEFGGFRLVGHGDVTNSLCGAYKRLVEICTRTELHSIITLDGKNYAGKVYYRRARIHCYKPDCPICFKKGWAVREAGRIEARLKEGSKRFGMVEHIVASVPVVDYGLSYDALRKKVAKLLAEVGVIGGVVIFHGFRFNKRQYWYWSPHWHVLGFIAGGYSRCRHCTGGDCRTCGGFEGKCYLAYDRTGWIIRVLGERKTVGGTAWYQLNHASIKVGSVRFHVATWFGVCSYRKLKATVELRKKLCPICKHELEKGRYLGVKRLENEEGFEDALDERGNPLWVIQIGGKERSMFFAG